MVLCGSLNCSTVLKTKSVDFLLFFLVTSLFKERISMAEGFLAVQTVPNVFYVNGFCMVIRVPVMPCSQNFWRLVQNNVILSCAITVVVFFYTA